MPPRVDRALALRVEAAHAAQLEDFARAVAEHGPRSEAGFASVAGGSAVFVVPRNLVSRAAGLGLAGPVEASDVEAVERFYRGRDDEARIVVSPFADPSLHAHLGERGFRLADLDVVLVRGLGPDEPLPEPDPSVDVRRAGVDDAAAWVRASRAGFTPPGEAPDLEHAPIFEATFHAPSLTFLTACVAGRVAGTAGLHVHGATAHLFADSTLPELRGRGVHAALIAARLALAREAGCDLAFAATAAGGGSQRNYARAGFTRAYVEALFVKRLTGEGA